MTEPADIQKFAPPFAPDEYNAQEQRVLKPFFSSLASNAYVPMIFSPELVGALCSRTSRAKDDLRMIFLKEFLNPFLTPAREAGDTDAQWAEKQEVSRGVADFIEFLQVHPIEQLFLNPKARNFYLKWLSQYGDDSIAQMGGTHLVYSGLSQVAIKHLEDQRIGLAPLEKSTRYVDYSKKISGQYRYYRDPSLSKIGLEQDYETVMDNLFETYTSLLPRVTEFFAKKYPAEPALSVKTKAFDTLRGLLPSSTLSQVAFFGNGQAFEYMINRGKKHPLGEVRWAVAAAKEQLDRVIPAFLYRTDAETTKAYQEYLNDKNSAVFKQAEKSGINFGIEPVKSAMVKLLEYDELGEDKLLIGLLYSQTHESWATLKNRVQAMDQHQKSALFDSLFALREARWHKVPRAFENAYVRFEIIMDIGAWRDLHRHRMQTQMRQRLSPHHGYFVPPELLESGLADAYRQAMEKTGALYEKIARHDEDLAQYATCLAHRLRFMQYQNLRQFFWEAELRSIPEGHPNYRYIEQEKFRLLEAVYPNLAKHARVNMNDYVFARRGQDEKVKQKEAELKALRG